MPSGRPINKFGVCDRCGQPFQLHASKQKRCDPCRRPARLEHANAQAKIYYRKHKERVRVQKRVTEAKRIEHYRATKRRNMAKRRFQARRMVIGFYSHGTFRCGCCGESQYDFLEVDHVNGGGNGERLKVFGHTGVSSAFYHWLIKNDFPPGYQILCSNCNKSKGKHGACVHQRPIPPPYERIVTLESWLGPPPDLAGEAETPAAAVETTGRTVSAMSAAEGIL